MRRILAWLASSVLLLAAGLLLFQGRAAHAEGDWEVKRSPFDPRLVSRFKAVLKRDPHDSQALRRLVSLYTRYSRVDKLIDEYQASHAKDRNAEDAVILGHLYRHKGALEQASEYYELGAALRTGDGTLHLLRLDIYRRLRRIPDATAAGEQALASARTKGEKRAILRTLADLALDENAIDRARVTYSRVLELDPGDIDARLDLADALARYQLHEDALQEYGLAEGKLKGDPTRRIDVLTRMGKVLEATGRQDEALRAYHKAMELAQKGSYLQKEITERIIDIHRKRQDVQSLIEFYERKWPIASRRHFEWDVLARLFEATGDQDKALDAYRKAVNASPSELDTHKRFIALLELAGKDREAVLQYETLIRIAPGEPRFPLELAERYFRLGDKNKALELLRLVARRFPDDGGVHAMLAELYSRWGEEKLALEAHETLARIEPEDPNHLVNLGEQHFQRGEKSKAIEIWKRIAHARTPEAYARLAEVYSEHDMGAEAVDTYLKAIGLEPKSPVLFRGLAGVLERQRLDDRAIEAWEKVLELTSSDPSQKGLRREARTRIITMFHRKPGNPLLAKAREWQRRFDRNPGDVEAGYFLSEAYLKLGRHEDALRALKKLLATNAGDLDAMHQLVSVHRNLRQYDEAIALLGKLAELSPGRERDYFTQIAELQLALYRDDEAIAYVQKALEKSPNDPLAQERLAEIFEKREEFLKAVEAYKRAIELSPRNFKVRFALARLFLRRGEHQEAALLYREIIKRATDEDTIRSAARKAIDLEEYLGSLGELETHVAPLAFLHGQKPIYRRILVEVIDRYVPALVAQARRGSENARHELGRLGEHGLKPLLEALSDQNDPQQQRIAVRVLGHLRNRNAAAPLVKLAMEAPPTAHSMTAPPRDPGLPDMEMRVEALLAAGRLGDPRIMPQLIHLAAHREKAIRMAATWALGRTADQRALNPLVNALLDPQPAVQALACLGLGKIGDIKILQRALEILRDPQAASESRAACARALGTAASPTFISPLLQVLSEGNDDVQRNAAWALGRIGDKSALRELLRVFFSKKGTVREAVAWAIGRSLLDKADSSPLDESDMVFVGGLLDHRRLLYELSPSPTAKEMDPMVVVGHEAEISEGIRRALSRHRDMVLRILDDLDTRADGLGLGPMTASVDGLPDPQKQAVLTAVDHIGQSLVTDLEALCAHDDPEIRQLALGVLAKTGNRRALAQLEKALADSQAPVRISALQAIERIARSPHGQAFLSPLGTAVLNRLTSPSWQERALSCQVAATIGGPQASAPLAQALSDSSGFVREQAARALGRLAKADVVLPLLAATEDEVAEVRLAAISSLVPSEDPRARSRLEELAKQDPDPRVRAAAAKKP